MKYLPVILGLFGLVLSTSSLIVSVASKHPNQTNLLMVMLFGIAVILTAILAALLNVVDNRRTE